MTISESAIRRLDRLDLVLSVLIAIWAFAAEPEPWVPVVIIVVMGLLLAGLPRLINLFSDRPRQGVR